MFTVWATLDNVTVKNENTGAIKLFDISLFGQVCAELHNKGYSVTATEELADGESVIYTYSK